MWQWVPAIIVIVGAVGTLVILVIGNRQEKRLLAELREIMADLQKIHKEHGGAGGS